MESVRGLTVHDAMVRFPPSVFMDMTIPEIARQWRMTSFATIPVLAMGETVIGVLTLKTFAKAVNDNIDPRTTAGQLADHDVPVVHEASSLEDVLVSVGRQHRQIPVVDSFGQLSGLIDLDTITARGALAHLDPTRDPSEESFDAIS
jgi:predicted transcriptional regulator